MIVLSINDKGLVGIVARGNKSILAIRKLKYLKRRGDVAATLWTYLPDLKRDLRGHKIVLSDGFADTLRAVKEAVDVAQVGDDEDVKACFAEGRTPYSYQLAGIHLALAVKRCVLADDTGLGKTIQAMGAMLTTFRRGLITRAVLVVPAGLKYQWFEEITEFAAEDALPSRVVVVSGDKKKRSAIYQRPWSVMIVNPELVRNDVSMIERCMVGVGFVALDEASCIRNADTEIAKAMKHLFARTKYRLALTATPVENRLADLYSIFEWVDHRVFPSREYFNKRYVVFKKRILKIKGKRGRIFRVKQLEPYRYKNLDEVQAKIRPHYIRRRVSDVGLQLPSLVVKWELVDLPKRQREVYEACRVKAENELVELRGAAMQAPLQALRQACNSTALVESSGSRSRPAQAKVDRLKELLDHELAGEQVIVFTEYERFVKILERALKSHRPVSYTGKMDKRERTAALSAFKCGDRRILLATKAGERGHNLQNASVVVNLDLPFNPAAIKQRIGRAVRIKSKHQVVRMINFVATDTIEESLVLKKIYKRRKLFEDIFDEDELTRADPVRLMSGGEVVRLLK